MNHKRAETVKIHRIRSWQNGRIIRPHQIARHINNSAMIQPDCHPSDKIFPRQSLIALVFFVQFWVSVPRNKVNIENICKPLRPRRRRTYFNNFSSGYTFSVNEMNRTGNDVYITLYNVKNNES